MAQEAQRLWAGAGVPPFLTSFRPEALRAAQAASPQLPRGLLLDTWWDGWRETALSLGCVALVCNHGLWEPDTHPGFGTRHEVGTFVWAELYARDTEGANTFYGGLFHDALFGPDARPDFGRAPDARGQFRFVQLPD